MAEIRIQRRRSRGTWPWLIVLALPIAYLLYWGTRGRVRTAAAAADSSAFVIPRDTARAPDPVALFADYVANPDTTHSEDALRRRAGEALGRLADAVATLNAADAPSNAKEIGRARREADFLSHPKPHAPPNEGGLHLHDGAVAIANVLESVERVAYPSSAVAVARVRPAAGDIRTQAPLGSQRDRIQQFWLVARDAVAAMHAPAGPPAGGGASPPPVTPPSAPIPR